MAGSEIFLMLVMVAQAAADVEAPTIHDPPAERLEYMQRGGASYKVTGGDGKPLNFRQEPVLRWTNPVSGVVEGGLFVWEDEAKRPMAAAQFFIAPGTEKLWIHEFQSLAQEPLRFEYEGQPVWTPSQRGVELKPVDRAPPPAATPAARLQQMRQIARRFSVKDFFEGKSDDALRLMSTPLARYSDDAASDGAVFAFAHGTDPEMFVVIEARSINQGESPKWHVGLAPMTGYAITAELDDQPYWSVEWRKAPHPITAIFKNFVFPPES